MVIKQGVSMQAIKYQWVFRARLPGTMLDNQAELGGRDHGRLAILSKVGTRMGREYVLQFGVTRGYSEVTKDAQRAKLASLGSQIPLRDLCFDELC